MAKTGGMCATCLLAVNNSSKMRNDIWVRTLNVLTLKYERLVQNRAKLNCEAKPSATAALCEDFCRLYSFPQCQSFNTPSTRSLYDEWKFVKLIGGKAMINQLLLMVFDLGLLSHECGY